jgi:serine/threonine-protein kinase
MVRAQSSLGTWLRDKWRLDALLGVGGMAAVYAATHRNGSRAAVKILHPEMAADDVLRQRFLWEGYVANSVAHEGVVNILDDDAAEDGSLFLVTELLEGETLEERRVRLGGRLPQDEVLLVADRVLDVLAAAHDKGIVHRDLKPENVFLTRAGQVKVLDFGIARVRERSGGKRLTGNGIVMGTPAYMAPEQARGLSDKVDERSDLWACGAVMFTLLSGRHLHEGRSVNEQLSNAIRTSAPSLGSIAPDVRPAVARVVDRALQFSKARRWADARSMQQAVRRAYEEHRGLPRVAVPRSTPRARPVPPAAVGAAAFGLAVMSVVGLVAPGRPTSVQPAVIVSASIESSPASAPSVALTPPAVLSELATADWPSSDLSAADSASAAAMAAPPPARSPSKKGGSQSAAASIPATSGDCRPPYTVEPNGGKQHWKVECL